MTFLDLETTGLSITKDRIIQIAVVRDGVEKSMLVNPMKEILPTATEIHGITNEMVSSAPTFKQISKSLLEFIGDSDLAGYNSNKFDIPILIEEFARVGIDFDMSDRRVVDVFQIECDRFPRTLSAVYERVTGKELEGAHDALTDVRATIEIFEDQKDDLGDVVYSQKDDMVDVAGKLVRIDGEVCWNFGKWMGFPLTKDLSYCNWVLKNDFSKQIKDEIRKCL